jgi:formate hydrogenlyase subunit 4
MNVPWPLAALIYGIHAIVIPPLLVGFIRAVKSRLQRRRGPSIWQPFRDIAKLLRKGETISETVTWAFRAGPLVSLATTFALSLMIPWLGLSTPIAGDLFLAIYLIALGKFVISLAALDTGSSFGALGASREAAVSIQSETAAVLALAALAVHARSSSLPVMLAPTHHGPFLPILAALILATVWLTTMAELARMPFDDPTTHLELTMIHEALILENSGRNLALAEVAYSLKACVLFGLLAQILLVALPPMPAGLAYLVSLAFIAASGLAVAISESIMVKLRWRKIPNLLSYAMAAGILACLVVAVKG